VRDSWVLKLVKALVTITVIVVLAFVGMRALVGTKGSGLPYLDVLFVPDEWFVATRVAAKGPTTVYIEGVAPGLAWTGPPANREWLVTGSTLMLTEANVETYAVRDDGLVAVEYTFGAGASQQATGWRVVKIQQGDLGQPKAAAFVIVDLTRGVWLKRVGYLQWDEMPME
jgi:hypothetical protein